MRRFARISSGALSPFRARARRDGNDVPFLAIPYFSWANRGPGEMAVWIPSAPRRRAAEERLRSPSAGTSMILRNPC